MKKLVILAALFLTGLAASAQSVVSGTVVDKDGNPIANARVEMVGSTESCMTGLDGTFRMETPLGAKKVKVLYVGMLSKKQRVRPDMTVTLHEENVWNRRPDKYRWFLSAQAATPSGDLVSNLANPSVGLMLGRVKHVGWYVKATGSKPLSATEQFYSYRGSTLLEALWTTGKMESCYYSATGGVILRLGSPIHIYGGCGWGHREFAMEMNWHGKTEMVKIGVEDIFGTGKSIRPYNTFVAEAGIMMRLGHFTLNAGCSQTIDGYNYLVGNFGIGYCF